MKDFCYVRPADASGSIWFIHEPSGMHIGACSAREAALEIARIANSGAIVREAQKSETSVSEGPAVNTIITQPDHAVLIPTANAGTRMSTRVKVRPVALEWHAPRRRRKVLSLLKKCYRHACRKTSQLMN